MYNSEGMCPDLIDPFGVDIYGTMITAFEQSDSLWFQLGALLRALDIPGVDTCGLASKVGNQFYDSGEFRKYKGIWYGTVRGLTIYANDLCESQLLLNNNLNKETARTRCRVLTKWLSDVRRGAPEMDGVKACPPGCDAREASPNTSSPPDELPMLQETNEDSSLDSKDESVPDDVIGYKTLALDMAMFDRLRDNLLSRVPYLAACLSIADDVPLEQKLFAVVATSVLHPYQPIDRPNPDPTGIWQGKDSIYISDAVYRSMTLV